MILADTFKNKEARSEEKNMEQLQAVVQHYCLSLTRSRWDAEDLAQETWLKGMRAEINSTHKNREALLLRIAKNTWIDQSRRRTQYARLIRQEKQAEAANNTGSLELEEALYALMKHLSPLQRTVFMLRDALGFSARETAKLLNSTAGAIKAALHRARESLHEVRRELQAEAGLYSTDEDTRSFIWAMAAAYQAGDLALLIELAQRDVEEAAMISGITQNKRLQAVSHGQHSRAKYNKPYTIEMAA
jgi:RNA polymerase sigma factor (sigma-70 family)